MVTTAAAFDTLQYAKKLEQAGFTPQQAEVQAEAIKELIDNKLTTKDDLCSLEERLNNKMNELGYKLTIRLGGMLITGIVALSIIIKLF